MLRSNVIKTNTFFYHNCYLDTRKILDHYSGDKIELRVDMPKKKNLAIIFFKDQIAKRF